LLETAWVQLVSLRAGAFGFEVKVDRAVGDDQLVALVVLARERLIGLKLERMQIKRAKLL
jgi:hypothetical protein